MIPKTTRICKICGKEYEYCKTKARGQFIWRDVACCPEHAEQYFEAVAIARGEKKPQEPEQTKKQNKESSAKKPVQNKADKQEEKHE